MGKVMKKVFISLPITSRPEPTLEERISEAKKEAWLMANVFRKEGYEPITPFDVTKDGMSEAQCIGACITALLECDCVYFCKGWETSRGCRIEHLVAVEHNIEII